MTKIAPHARIALLGAALCSQAWANTPAMEASPAAGGQGFSSMQAEASMSEGKLHAKIEGRAATDCSKAWLVFTDFDKMTQFLPGIESSKVKSREGNHVTIIQKGSHSFGIFSKRYQSERVLTMAEPSSIESKSAASDEIPITSSTTFTPMASGCSIVYATAIAVPDWIPGFAAVGFAKSMARTQMGAMIAEVKKRFGPAPAAPSPAKAKPEPKPEPKPQEEPSQEATPLPKEF